MTPIEKNIIVVDENGNQLEATYPKRAKGLVKCGRARFINETTICLTCPPPPKTEEHTMSEHIIEPTLQSEPLELTDEYILSQIERIAADRAYLEEALVSLNAIQTGGPGDVGAAGKAEGISRVVKAHQETNRRLLDFYESLWRDRHPRPATEREKLLATLVEQLSNPAVSDCTKDSIMDLLADALKG